MRWPLPPPLSLRLPLPKKRTWVLGGGIALVSLVCLLAFHPTSKADSTRTEPQPTAAVPVAHGPVWVPEVVTAPGLPLQCSDGTWTRSVVRGGCLRHGGVTY
jgi:hypothetical protein